MMYEVNNKFKVKNSLSSQKKGTEAPPAEHTSSKYSDLTGSFL